MNLTQTTSLENSMLSNAPLALCGDCLDILPQIPENSIDMILCDLPYHITQNSWDKLIPLEDYIIVGDYVVTFTELNKLLWNHHKRQYVKNQPDFKKLLSSSMGDIVKFWNANKQSGLWSNYKRILKSREPKQNTYVSSDGSYVSLKT